MHASLLYFSVIGSCCCFVAQRRRRSVYTNVARCSCREASRDLSAASSSFSPPAPATAVGSRAGTGARRRRAGCPSSRRRSAPFRNSGRRQQVGLLAGVLAEPAPEPLEVARPAPPRPGRSAPFRPVAAGRPERDERAGGSSEFFLGGESRAEHGTYGDKLQSHRPQQIRKQYTYEAHVICKLDPTHPLLTSAKLRST
jgi:hypothetical protein